MKSLFDYLGRAAGPDLGLEVFKYAKSQGATINKRQVSNPQYTGPVNLYDENILIAFFNNPNHSHVIKADELWYNNKQKEKNNLPF